MCEEIIGNGSLFSWERREWESEKVYERERERCEREES